MKLNVKKLKFQKKENWCLYSILLVVLLSFSSCAGFKNKFENPTFLTKENVYLLNGVYNADNVISDSKEDSLKPTLIYHHNFLQEIDRKLLDDTLNFKPNKVYSFGLEMLSPKTLKISYLEDGRIYRTRTIKAKITKDGYLKLKNKNVGFVLVPYIFGRLDINKTRITLDKNSNLIFDKVNTQTGAALLVMFLNASTSREQFIYPKMINSEILKISEKSI